MILLILCFQKRVIVSGTDAEDVIVTIASKAMGIPVLVWLLDPRPSLNFMCVNGETVQLVAAPGAGANIKSKSEYLNALSSAPGVHLLLRPGHYDLLYSRNDKEVIRISEHMFFPDVFVLDCIWQLCSKFRCLI